MHPQTLPFRVRLLPKPLLQCRQVVDVAGKASVVEAIDGKIVDHGVRATRLGGQAGRVLQHVLVVTKKRLASQAVISHPGFG